MLFRHSLEKGENTTLGRRATGPRNFCICGREFSFNSLSCRFSENSSAHGFTQAFIWDRTGEKTGRKWRPLVCYLRLMFSREIQLETRGEPVTFAPRWLRVPGSVNYSGLSRSKLCELLSDGKIRSICLRSQKGIAWGLSHPSPRINFLL
jgi:hypothetical protein